jgi:hypothetical protein
MRRAFVLAPLAPLAVVALALALSADASAGDGQNGAAMSPAAGAPRKPPKLHRGSKHRSNKAVTSLQASIVKRSKRTWGDFIFNDGQLPDPVAGATCPPEMANIDDRFCIDRWEASLVEVTHDGRQTPWPPYGPIEEGRVLRAVSAPRVYPQAYISAAGAERACAAAGKRLCAPVEWRTACMGPKQRTFGYGDERITGRCNDHGQSPMLRLYPQVATSWRLVGTAEMNDPQLNQLTATLAPTGSHAGCTNEYGVFDMVGNLHEWTNDPGGTFQGGYYLDTHINGDGCAYKTIAHEYTYHDYSTGFRCCAEAGSR